MEFSHQKKKELPTTKFQTKESTLEDGTNNMKNVKENTRRENEHFPLKTNRKFEFLSFFE